MPQSGIMEINIYKVKSVGYACRAQPAEKRKYV